jgi:hypothetical protein
LATRLTDRAIAALKPRAKSDYHFDSDVTGLAIRVYPSGIKSFIFDWRENGRQRRITLGQHPAGLSARRASMHPGCGSKSTSVTVLHPSAVDGLPT